MSAEPVFGLHYEGNVHSRYSFALFVMITAVLASVLFLYQPAQGEQTAVAGGATTHYLPIVLQENRPHHIGFAPYFLDNDLLGDITDIEHAGDGRVFVVERPGRILVFQNGILLDTFLDLPGLVGGSNWEEGLLGLAFPPDYPATPHFFVQYTESGPLKRIVVARYTVSSNPNQADPHSGVILMHIDKSPNPPGYLDPISPVHNGGDLTFGPDGYLYIPVGDGGPDPFEGINGDPDNDSQNLNTLLGKLLRIDIDPAAGLPPECGDSAYYSIPADNPFVGEAGCAEIWAYGLRNPWRISFDKLTGDLYITDVGEWQYEEVNFVPAGQGSGWNFGWNCYEGSYIYRPGCPGEFVFPVFEYERGLGCASIIGGYVYRGSQYPNLYGYYLFADYCAEKMWAMKQDRFGQWRTIEFPLAEYNFTTFGEDVNGELYAGRSDFDGIYQVTAP